MYDLTLQSSEGPIRVGFQRNTQYFGGELNQRYTIRVTNDSHRRVEAVVTVDGLSVIDGKPGAYASRGMLVPARSSVDFDGWRTSLEEVAAFRISSPTETYAGVRGNLANIGIIGLAIFSEKGEAFLGSGYGGMLGATRGVTKGAGTAFGEQHTSRVRTTNFDRASATPAAVKTFRYDTIPALVAAGILLSGDGPQAFPGNAHEPAFCKPA